MEVISAQQVWPKSFLIWTRLSLLIASYTFIFSGLSPFIQKEKHFLTFLSLFFLVLCVIIYFVIYLYYHKNGALNPLLICMYSISEKSIRKNQAQRTGFLVYLELDFYCLCSLQKSILKLIFAD